MATADSTVFPSRGLVLGRFMPPHNGHRFLIDFARSMVDELDIFLCSLPDEEIPGTLRYDWMRELYPECRIVHCTEAIPEAGRNNPNAPSLWAAYIQPRLKHKADYVFASEDYGELLAQSLGAEFISVDISRSNIPVSGRAVRQDPFLNWKHLPVPVRPYFARIFGFPARDAHQVSEIFSAARELETIALLLDSDQRKNRALIAAALRQCNQRLLVCGEPGILDDAFKAAPFPENCRIAESVPFTVPEIVSFVQ
ncbi:adenylyltransferase/cytidyltransferase family protein [Spirochaeta dissipatitropha]